MLDWSRSEYDANRDSPAIAEYIVQTLVADHPRGTEAQAVMPIITSAVASLIDTAEFLQYSGSGADLSCGGLAIPQYFRM